MRRELEPVLQLASSLLPDELPQLLGDLELIRVTAFARLANPRVEQKMDELLSVEQAAARLHVSLNYLYRNHGKFSFTRREGRKLLFSSVGLDSYLRKSR
jgi:hypothetical protein